MEGTQKDIWKIFKTKCREVNYSLLQDLSQKHPFKKKMDLVQFGHIFKSSIRRPKKDLEYLRSNNAKVGLAKKTAQNISITCISLYLLQYNTFSQRIEFHLFSGLLISKGLLCQGIYPIMLFHKKYIIILHKSITIQLT